MNQRTGADLSASIRQRLLNLARSRHEEYQRVLTRFAFERLLYRLSRSEHRGRFVLKGALLFAVWSDLPHRATKDLDLLGRMSPSVPEVEAVFRSLCTTPLAVEEQDGTTFLAESVTAEEIREENIYGGVRVHLMAAIGTARLPLHVDVGFGDVIVPAPEEIQFPVLLDLPSPRLQAYARETVVAEKLEAMVTLGIGNSRMKDFYDLWALSTLFAFDGPKLAAAIAATFQRRATALPTAVPEAWTDVFTADPSKLAQWRAFLHRSRLSSGTPSLADAVQGLRDFLMPVLDACCGGVDPPWAWPAGGPWTLHP